LEFFLTNKSNWLEKKILTSSNVTEQEDKCLGVTLGFCGLSSLVFSVIFCERQPQLLLNNCSLGAVTSGLLRTMKLALFMHEALTYVYLLGTKQVDGVCYGSFNTKELKIGIGIMYQSEATDPGATYRYMLFCMCIILSYKKKCSRQKVGEKLLWEFRGI
jgi:hypothetical protein